MRSSRNAVRRSTTGRTPANATAVLATALLDIEPHLRKLMGFRHLPQLRAALKRELKIDTKPLTKEAACRRIRSRREFQLR